LLCFAGDARDDGAAPIGFRRTPLGIRKGVVLFRILLIPADGREDGVRELGVDTWEELGAGLLLVTLCFRAAFLAATSARRLSM